MEVEKVICNDTQKKKSLLANRSFIFLWLTSSASFLALSTYLITEQWYIITVLKEEKILGIVMMVTMIPRVIFMFFGGVLADRFKKSKIMFYSSFFRFGLILAMIVLLKLDLLEIIVLTCFAFFFGTLDAFFSPANTSLLTTLVSKEDLTRANSFIQTSNQIALFSGPMIGGWLLTVGSFDLLLSIVALLLLFTFILSLFINEEKNNYDSISLSTKNQLREGISYVWNMKFLKNIIIILVIINFFFFGPLLIGIPLLVYNVLNGKALDLSFLQSSYQGGMFAGAILVGLLNYKKKRGKTILVLITSLGFFLFILGQIQFTWQGIILLISMGTISSIINVNLISVIQEKSNQDKIGRVMSIVNAFSNGLVPLSYGVVSFALVLNLTISNVMLLCGALIVVFSLIFLMKSHVIKEVE
ncbi:MFS transporter [Radiobacillus deserti]|uniref:MFS transporter n=1 Tax=Radiobacillus deserti TaxID=2594883 RepID=A0A516KHL3_9BACI|nr:MFS transporter [Radiobacillus deserti]QDP40874.1 MFS transporter [Radiobacillus deserti]